MSDDLYQFTITAGEVTAYAEEDDGGWQAEDIEQNMTFTIGDDGVITLVKDRGGYLAVTTFEPTATPGIYLKAEEDRQSSDGTSWGDKFDDNDDDGYDDDDYDHDGSEDDDLNGDDSDDDMHGGGGHDDMNGGRGDDDLDGGDDDDDLHGGRGDDSLQGGHGDDSLDGGKGEDSLCGDVGDDSIAGGSGSDTVDYSAAVRALKVHLGQHHANGADIGRDILRSVENIWGGRGADDLIGSKRDNSIWAGRGDDDLRGGRGDDNLSGGKGDDDLRGGKGHDVMKGGGGDDTFVFGKSDGHNRVRDFHDGHDMIEIVSGANSFDDLSITDRGSDTVLRFADTTIVLQDVDANLISADDFLFS